MWSYRGLGREADLKVEEGWFDGEVVEDVRSRSCSMNSDVYVL